MRSTISTPNQLRAVREKLGLTRAQLAERLGIAVDLVASMEQGRRPIRKVTQLAIEHLNCPAPRKRLRWSRMASSFRTMKWWSYDK